MTDGRHLSEDFGLTEAEAGKKRTEERRAAEEQAFADKLARHPVPKPSRRHSR
jgi:hypothetical protein